MSKQSFDGDIGRKPVKTVVKIKEDGEKMWFSKPKEKNVNTVDFRENRQILSVHEDSADNKMYREMYPVMIGSMYFPQGKVHVPNQHDVALLPMTSDSNGYTVETSGSETLITLPKDGWVLVALGSWGAWKYKQNF